jgi:hypothetical protein
MSTVFLFELGIDIAIARCAANAVMTGLDGTARKRYFYKHGHKEDT